jgi:hypothetical protein
MSKSHLIGGLFAAALATTGCAPYLSPYGPGLAQPLIAPRPIVPVDPSASARGRWDNVMLLPTESVIGVLTMDGQRVGVLSRADGYSVRMVVDGVEQRIGRDDVLRVDLVHLPGSDTRAVARKAAGGALLGVGAGALMAAVIGGSAWPPPGVLLRGGAAVGGVSGAAAGLAEREGRVVYIAENQRAQLRRPAPIGSAPLDENEARPAASYAADEWTEIMQLRQSTPVVVITTTGVRH